MEVKVGLKNREREKDFDTPTINIVFEAYDLKNKG